MSDRYRNPRVRQHLDVFTRSLREGDAVLGEFCDNHTHDFVDMPEGLPSVLPHVEAPYRSSAGQ